MTGRPGRYLTPEQSRRMHELIAYPLTRCVSRESKYFVVARGKRGAWNKRR
jgi:hypothetical protein